VTVAPASKTERFERLTTMYSLRNGFLKPPRYGMRCEKRFWPPSKYGGDLAPVRAFRPLWPRPEGLTSPGPCPRPTRVRALYAPGLGRRSESLILSPPRPARRAPGAQPYLPCRG